jgi:DNA-binding transcriptional ArsR family regulator
MDSRYVSKIEDLALNYHAFYQLDDSAKVVVLHLLSRGVLSTLELIGLIYDTSITFEEVAISLGINHSTVTQKLSALKNGGFPLDMDDTTAIYRTGRPRELISR